MSAAGKTLASASVDDLGLAQITIGSQLLTFDAARYHASDAQDVVRVHHDGRITVGPVRYDHMPNWYGARAAMEPFAPTGRRGEMASSPVQVLGVVVDIRPDR